MIMKVIILNILYQVTEVFSIGQDYLFQGQQG